MSPSTKGYLGLFEARQFVPPTSTLNFETGRTRSPQTVVTLGAGRAVSVMPVMPSGATHLAIDVVGYFQ